MPPVALARTNLVGAAIIYLASSSHKMIRAALDLLIAIFGRSIHSYDPQVYETVILGPLFREGGIAELLHVWCNFHRVSSWPELSNAQQCNRLHEQSYSLLKRFADMIYELGSGQLCAKDIKTLPDNFDGFFDLVCAIGQHPSLIVSKFGIQLLADFLRHPALKTSFSGGVICPRLLEIIAPKLTKDGMQNAICEHYADLDLLLPEETASFTNHLHNARTQLIKSLAALDV
jgi:hypothetical protein